MSRYGRTIASLAAATVAMVGDAVAVPAQVASPPPSTTPAAPRPTRADSSVVVRRPASVAARPRPPLTPKRAFMTSAILPGLGQSRLDRGSSGALFASVELAAIVMLRRSNADFREARRFQTDTLATDYRPGVGTAVQRTDTTATRYTADLVRTRRLHREDWMAVLAFNHLFAGADAFVAAQLWDMPVQISAAPSPNGAMLVASWRF